MKVRYEAMFMLQSLGDTMGFKNGDWEVLNRRHITLDIVNELVYEFITLGGINGIDIKDWKASDDTLYHLSTGRAMMKYKGELDKKFMLRVKNEIIRSHNKMAHEINDKIFNRIPGINTIKYIHKYTHQTDASHHPYDESSGGNGCAMKMMCVGGCLYGKKRRGELIDVSIRIGKMTHNSPIGFLAGMNTALFTALSIEGVEMNRWCFILMDILKSKQVRKWIDSESVSELNDYIVFIKQWKKYIDTKYDDKEKRIRTKSHTNLMLRVKYQYENFVKGTKTAELGGSGFSACIMAYDNLLDCTGNWEKLFVYSALQPGDSDTVTAIAGSWYGMQYGYGDVPVNLLKSMEFSRELKMLSRKIFEKFYKK